LDTVTHIVLGACIGEAIAGRQLSKRVLPLGALAQNLPDIDFVAGFWMPVSGDLLAHRGITHSILFAVLVTPLLAFVSRAISARLSFGRWALFWGAQVFVHIFIDAFNAYGTGWFEPFSHYRVSFNSMFVADPLFTIWPAIAMLLLLGMRTDSDRRIPVANTAIVLCSAYLVAGVAFKLLIETRVEQDLGSKVVSGRRHFTTPTPLNNLLWYIVVENDSGYFTGYSSVLDRTDTRSYRFVPRNEALLNAAPPEDVAKLKRFSQGYYTVDKINDTLEFNVLRFGEILGWERPAPRFVFHYFLQYPEDNKVVVQRGRFAGWDNDAIRRFVRRIEGI